MPEHTIPNSLVENIRNGRAAIVVGAGIGVPSWKQLLERMNTELRSRGQEGDEAAAKDVDKLLHKGNLVRAAAFLGRQLGEEVCDRVVAETWTTPEDMPNVAKAIAGLPVKQVWTTFPGDLIETAMAKELPEEWPLPNVRTYLEAELGRPVAFPIADSYEATAQALAQGEVPYASLPPYLYVSTSARNPQVHVVAVKLYAGTKGSDGLLLVNAEQSIDGPGDLVGRVFCYTDTHSTTGYALPRAWLREHGVEPDTAFASTHLSGNHMQLIRDVGEGRCDAGGTYSGAWQTAAEAGVPVASVRQLAVTGRTPHDALSVGPSATDPTTADLRRALLAFHPQEHAGQAVVGTVERISGFADLGDGHYDKLRQALEGADPAR